MISVNSKDLATIEQLTSLLNFMKNPAPYQKVLDDTAILIKTMQEVTGKYQTIEAFNEYKTATHLHINIQKQEIEDSIAKASNTYKSQLQVLKEREDVLAGQTDKITQNVKQLDIDIAVLAQDRVILIEDRAALEKDKLRFIERRDNLSIAENVLKVKQDKLSAVIGNM